MVFARSSLVGLTLPALFFVATAVAGQGLAALSPAQAGFLPERLERIDRAIDAAVADGELPGAVAMVIRNGAVVYHKAFGYSNIESRKSMKTDSIFRIASMTKAITTVGVMMLYEEGRFQLNDPVAEFLPEFGSMRVISEMAEDGTVAETVPAQRPIRIVDLLSHSSGLSYPFNPDRLQKTYRTAGVIDSLTASDMKLEDQVRLIARQPLLFEPGTGFRYSLSTDVLGRFLEVVSGRPLDRFLAERITGPLGMKDTYFHLPEDKAGRLVTLYAHVDGRGLVVSRGDESEVKVDNPNFPIEGARTFFSGGAGLVSTADDYARFAQMLLNGGELEGVRLLGRKSVELMRTPRVDWDGDQAPDFGLGFQVVSDLGKRGELGSVGSYSWGGAFYTNYWIDPEERLIGIFLAQARPCRSDLRVKFPTLVYQALE